MKKNAFLILFTCLFPINLVNAQSDTILLLNELKSVNKLELKVSDITLGQWKGISNSGEMLGSDFKGWKASIEIRNTSDSIKKVKIPSKLLDSLHLTSSLYWDARFTAVDYLKKYNNLYESSSMAKGYTGIISSFSTGKKNVVLNLIAVSKGFILEFFNPEQKIIAKLNTDYELELYPGKTLKISVFYNGNHDMKPIGLILK